MKHYNEIFKSYNAEPHPKKTGKLDRFLKIIGLYFDSNPIKNSIKI